MSGFAELARAAATALTERPSVPLALATLVQVEGSSYRQPGARLLVDAEGRVLAGAISGGCLEGDVAQQAESVCRTRSATTLRYDLRDDLETIWGFGSACDGIAHIVLEPLPDPTWLRDAAAARTERTGGILLTTAQGTRPMRNIDGVWCVEPATEPIAATPPLHAVDNARASRLAEMAWKTARTRHDVESNADQTGRYFVEPLLPVVSLFLVGAGRGAEAFSRIASTLGWEVTVIDHRAALLEGLVLPAHTRSFCARAEDGADLVRADARTAVALLSHIFDVDAAWLTALLPKPIGYIGVLGSRARAARLLTLVGAQTAFGATRRVHAPIGLDLGGETPESIALAAVAEIEAVMHGRPGGFLRERESPIHGRTPTPHPSSTLSSALEPTLPFHE